MLHDSSLALTAQVEKVAAAATPDLFFFGGGRLLLIGLNGPEAFRASRSRCVPFIHHDAYPRPPSLHHQK